MKTHFLLSGIIIASLFSLSLNSCTNKIPKEGIVLIEKEGKHVLYIDGKETYIKGVGGMNRLDMASQNGANAFRTWGGNVESVRNILKTAAEYNMYVMQGIGLTKDSARYFDDKYKEQLRNEVRALADTFKDNPHLLVWGIGNEIELGNANIPEAWMFVEELAQIIRSIDSRHLISTVTSHNAKALDLIAKYAPSLDIIGINSYGSIGGVEQMVKNSEYNGPYLITEWGPTGFWETAKTSWNAPLEQTSEEKRIVYEDRYNQHIFGPGSCVGSFVFLWGQKEERTPTWFSMFVESNVPGLPLNGEKTPQVEAMERVWAREEPEQTAPVITGFKINEKKAIESITLSVNEPIKANVSVHDKNEDTLTYIWEILHEATVLGFGGSREPRPDRYGEVIISDTNQIELAIKEAGKYRVYIYVSDNTGFVATANIPVLVQ